MRQAKWIGKDGRVKYAQPVKWYEVHGRDGATIHSGTSLVEAYAFFRLCADAETSATLTAHQAGGRKHGTVRTLREAVRGHDTITGIAFSTLPPGPGA